jgi:outer membrane lipoprotein SlyB
MRPRLWQAAAGLAALAVGGCIQEVPPVRQPGVILAASPVDQASENTGAGAIVGIVAGGIAGGSLGQGAGQAIGAGLGGLAGGVAGSAAESALNGHDGIAYTVRLNDGRVVTLLEHVEQGDQIFPVGAPVVLESSGREQHIVAP